jgi:hypothetical protein
MSKVKVADRNAVVLDAPVVIETQYRRGGEAPKPLTLYVLGYAVVRGAARLLATTDPADVSDGRLFLAHADSVSKLECNTKVEPWDVSEDEVAAVLSGLYFFGTYSSAWRQVQHVDTSNPLEILEVEQGYGGVPFSEVSADSCVISLIKTE